MPTRSVDLSSWARYPFADVFDFQEGPGILAKDFRENGVPLIRLAGLQSGNSILDGCNYLDPEMVDRRWAHFRLHVGDILLSTSASLGRTAKVDESGEGAVAYTGLIRMRPRDCRVVPTFIKFLLESPDFQQQVEAMGAGSVLRHFGPSHLRNMTVLLPPPPDQERISAVLAALEDKIELNRRMNRTLEELARAIFRSWFVDFDPVRAKAEGRQPAGMDAETAALFPDAFVDSVLGPIPAGWRLGAVNDLAKLGRQTLNPALSPNEFFEHYSLPAFDEGQRPAVQTGAEIKSNKVIVSPHSVLVSKLNPHIPRVWLPDVSGQLRAIGSTEFLVLVPNKESWRAFLYALTSSSSFLTSLASRVTGTTGSHQRVSPESLLSIPAPIPPEDLIHAFGSLTTPMFQRVAANRRESTTLAELRDSLLPKLLSGELRVPVAEEMVAGATA